MKFDDIKTMTLDQIKLYKNFPTDCYFQEETLKDKIVLHHTVSGNGSAGDENSWINNKNKVSTMFLIERDGTINQYYSSKYWSHHLGVKSTTFTKYGLKANNTNLNKSSISIELDNWGPLTKLGTNKYKTAYGSTISLDDSKVTYYENGFKGNNYYESYTEAQLRSLGSLLLYLRDNKVISLEYNPEIWNVTKENLLGKNGLYTHVSFREDKSDCHPDINLIELIKTLNKISGK